MGRAVSRSDHDEATGDAMRIPAICSSWNCADMDATVPATIGWYGIVFLRARLSGRGGRGTRQRRRTRRGQRR